MENSLVMSFDPKTIQHLGIRMYSTLPPVLAELIANSYDADAENVYITLIDDSEGKKIVIEDDGSGMSFTELNSKFLRIGRDRRYEEGSQKTPIKERKVIGKKGLGKLSFFGISSEVEVSTKKGGKENKFVMNWDSIKNSDKPVYNPEIISRDLKCSEEEKGTRIILKNIKRESDFNLETIADGLSKTFIVDADFKITVKFNDKQIVIDNQRKYSDLVKQVEWNVPEDIGLESEYKNKTLITGHIIATKFPIPSKTNMKGITLFSRKKLVNVPEYFSNSLSSHFFSYLTGWLEVDFIDDLEEDVISTNRQSLNWDHPEMAEMRAYLSKLMGWLERDWRIKRTEAREQEIEKDTGIKVSDWFSKLPDDVKSNVEPLVKDMLKNFEPTEESKEINSTAIKRLHLIAPEYTYWHYRNLHPSVKSWAEEDYKKGEDYYEAAEKASRSYIRSVKDKAEVDRPTEEGNMDDAFKIDGGKLRVTLCNTETEKTIQRGQHSLSKGVVAGCRNPLDHSFPNYQERLGDTGLFSEQDCLDMLSLISHLSRRLDSSTKETPPTLPE